MSKDYGAKKFEKMWIDSLTGFVETKIFFFHDKDKTTIKYIDKNQLLGVEMYRSDYEIERWLNHFQNYLDTGTFDSNAYWIEYESIRDKDGKLHSNIISDATALPMELKKKLWCVHSPELNKFMDSRRSINKDLGFKQVPRPQ